MRQAEDPEAKAAIARTASELIGDDDAVIFDNGTTAQAIAQRLAGRPITAMCLSLHSAAALGTKPGANIFVPGGEVEPDTLALPSVAVASALREFRADVVVLGSCSTSLEHGLATTTYDDAENKRTAMRAATRRILAVAPRKLNHVSTFRFGDIEDLHQLVTTTDAPAELLAQIRDLGAQVITAPAGK
ncbi:DeoR/GlpR family DNA-binding transcription regulator [Corynebacterium striatum]